MSVNDEPRLEALPGTLQLMPLRMTNLAHGCPWRAQRTKWWAPGRRADSSLALLIKDTRRASAAG